MQLPGNPAAFFLTGGQQIPVDLQQSRVGFRQGHRGTPMLPQDHREADEWEAGAEHEQLQRERILDR